MLLRMVSSSSSPSIPAGAFRHEGGSATCPSGARAADADRRVFVPTSSLHYTAMTGEPHSSARPPSPGAGLIADRLCETTQSNADHFIQTGVPMFGARWPRGTARGGSDGSPATAAALHRDGLMRS